MTSATTTSSATAAEVGPEDCQDIPSRTRQFVRGTCG
jgi:hypothetical protein